MESKPENESAHPRMFEQTFESQKRYTNPFNELEVDVVFSRDERSWRVPAFWRGEQKWTVRFAPPSPGEYAYRLESTDRNNPDLNGHQGIMRVAAYAGASAALKHGMVTVSDDRRYFQYADGTPFFWLGDTWWMGLSDRLSWDDFKRLTDDRKAKGFTVVQVVAGLIPFEEQFPVDPGFGNEGGKVWDPHFQHINPLYFDFVDRRIEYLLEQGITPAIVGAWNHMLQQMGVARMKQHWRYIIARYGAYPVLWIGGGEIYDPPEGKLENIPPRDLGRIAPWSEIYKYIRSTDPYRHPLAVLDALLLPALKEPTLTDYHLIQCDHVGWPSIATELTRLHQFYSDPEETKPIVIGEIGYEQFGGTNLEDFQRSAFWLAMVNGAAGFTYGANGTWESYTAERPHRMKWSSFTWEEGMRFPGSYQLGMAARHLRNYPWWQLKPAPQSVTPHGPQFSSTLARSHGGSTGEAVPFDSTSPGSDALTRTGSFSLPYAAVVPRRLRLIYIPYFGYTHSFTRPPTVHGLESGIRYCAYFWDPIHGIRFDLGQIQRPRPGRNVYSESYGGTGTSGWRRVSGVKGRTDATERHILVVPDVEEIDVVASVEGSSSREIGLVMRFIDEMNYLRAVYSPQKKAIFIVEKKGGTDGREVALTEVASLGPRIRLEAEVRDSKAIVSIMDDKSKVTSSIVDIHQPESAGIKSVCPPRAGKVGLWSANDPEGSNRIEVRASPVIEPDVDLQRKLYDARGGFRGELRGGGVEVLGSRFAGWDEFGRDKHILLDAYRPEKLPYGQDWVLVLEAVDG